MVYDDFAYLFIQIIINIYTCLHLTPYAIYILYTHAHTIYTYTYYMPMPILYTHIHTIYPCPYYIHIYILYTHAHTIYTYTYYIPMPILYTHIHPIYRH